MISSPKQQRQARANFAQIAHYANSDSDDSGDDEFVPDGFKKKRQKDVAPTFVSHQNTCEQPNLTRSHSRRDPELKALGKDSNEQSITLDKRKGDDHILESHTKRGNHKRQRSEALPINTEPIFKIEYNANPKKSQRNEAPMETHT